MDDWETRYQSLLVTHQCLERDLGILRAQVLLLETEKKQWDLEKETQKKIIEQALQQANATSNGYLEENNRLKERIRELTEG